MLSRIAKVWTLSTVALSQLVKGNQAESSSNALSRVQNPNGNKLPWSEKWGLAFGISCLLFASSLAIQKLLERCLTPRLRMIEENLEKAAKKKKTKATRPPHQRVTSTPYQPKTITQNMKNRYFSSVRAQKKIEVATDDSDTIRSINQSYKRINEYCNALKREIPQDAKIALAAKNCSTEDLIKHNDNITKIENDLRRQANERREPRKKQNNHSTTTSVSHLLAMQPQKKQDPTLSPKTNFSSKLNPAAEPFKLPKQPVSSPSSSEWDELNNEINRVVFNS